MKVREGKKEEGQQKHVIQKRVSSSRSRLSPSPSTFELTLFLSFKQPIPLDLLNLGDFTGALGRAPTAMGGGLISRKDKTEGGATDADAKIVFPFSYVVKSSGVMGGTYVLWADTDASRTEWRDKLQEAKTLSDVVADSNKVRERNERHVEKETSD